MFVRLKNSIRFMQSQSEQLIRQAPVYGFGSRAATDDRDETIVAKILGGGGWLKTGTEDASDWFERTRSILELSAAAE